MMQTPQEIVKATQLNTQIEMMRALSASTKEAATKAIELAREKASELLGDAAPSASGSRPSGGGGGGNGNSGADVKPSSEKGEKKATYLIEFYDMDVKYEGLVIGPGGMTIRKLQQDIGTDIQVVRGEGKLQIKGSREKIDFAREQLDIFFEQKGSKTERVNCKARSGLIIGNAGQTIKALKEQTGCRIEVMRDVEEVVITGPGDRVKVAKTIVEKMIADSWVEGADGNVTIVEEVIPCAYKAGAIIGPNGSTIRNIRETTGVAIDIERGANGCKASDQCRVVGTAKQVKKAVDLVRQLLREMDRVELQAAPTVPPMYAYGYGNPYTAAAMNPYVGNVATGATDPSQQMDPAAYARWYAQYQQHAAAAYGVHPNQVPVQQQHPPPSGNAAGDTTNQHQGQG